MDTYILSMTLGDFGGSEQKGETSVSDRRKLRAVVPIDKEALCEDVVRMSVSDLADALISKLKEDGILGA